MTTTTVFADEGYRIGSTGASYAIRVAGTGTLGPADLSHPEVGQDTAELFQSQQGIDTSSVPDTDVISSALLGLWVRDPASVDFTVQARLFDFGGEPVTEADWRTDAQLAACTLLCHYQAQSISSSSYTNLTDDAFAANVNKTGYTRIVLCSADNVTATSPSGAQYFTVYGDDTAHPPRLTITHVAGATDQPTTTQMRQLLAQ